MKKVTIIQRINFTKSNMAYVPVEQVIDIMRKGDFTLHDNQYGDYTLRQAVEFTWSLNMPSSSNGRRDCYLP